MPTIRPIEPSDRAEWGRLWTGYLEYYETVLPPAIYDTAFARLTSGHPAMHGLIGEVDSQPMGLVHYIFHDHFWRPEGVVYL